MSEKPHRGRLPAMLVVWLVTTGATAQICRNDIRASTPDGQLVDNGDGTVTDTATGLMWMQCAEGQSGSQCAEGSAATFTWQAALQTADEASFAGHIDWRLPSKNELESLIEQRCSDPAINASRFPNTPSTWFWSSSPNAGDGLQAWTVDFGNGDVEAYTGDGKQDAHPIRFVRGGQSAAPLTLSVAITGAGQVGTDDERIACPETCTTTYPDPVTVTLIASPSTGWQFLGWGGACTGSGQCGLRLDGPTAVTANFTELTNRYQLDSPVNDSFESGIGVVYGWVCEATRIGLQIDDEAPFQAAYGAERRDSQTICGDENNGFAAAINWNDYDDGRHTIKLLADDAPLTEATVETSGFGARFLRGLSASMRVDDFPVTGARTPLIWSEPHQNFVVGEATATTAGVAAASDDAGYNWESPLSDGHESGRALVRGWACEADDVTAILDGTPIRLPYGSGRDDTQPLCGDSDNGFAVAIDWNDYEDGPHRIALVIDGRTVETRTFTIATPDEQGRVTGVQKRHALGDFPYPGDQLMLQWSEPHQNFRMIAYTPMRAERDDAWRVTELYIATLGYAPDDSGLQYWVERIASDPTWSPLTVAQSFFDQPLVQATYPPELGFGPLIEALYENIFGRAADSEGLAYWRLALHSGQLMRNQMIIALADGGWANPEAAPDMARFGNRVRVGLAFAAAQAERGIDYDRLTQAQQERLRAIGRDLLSEVSADPESRETAIAGISERLDSL